MTGKVFIALIGAGGIGKRWARSIARVSEVKCEAIIDEDLSKAQFLAKQFKDCVAFNDWKKILKNDKINTVIIATPHAFLAPIAQAMLKAQKHVLSEKPAGIHSREIKKAIWCAQKNNLRYMVGFNHRFHEAFLLARRLYEQGKIGRIQFIRSRYGFGGRIGFEKEWRHNPAFAGGGELIDQGVHMIDMVRSFLGNITEVYGFVDSLYWNTPVDDNAFVLLKSKNKQIASIHVSWSNWKPIHSFEIYGAKGYLHIEGLGKKYGGTEKLVWGTYIKKDSDHPIEKEFMCDPEADNSLVRELQEFVSAIKNQRDPVPNGKDALEVLKIVEKIYGKK